MEQAVQALLDGDNFHFGNPFLDWGTSVCSSKAHPDQIVSREKCMRADKRRYYSDLEKYHNDIIDYLQMVKEKWERCKDPGKDAVKKIRRRSTGGSAHVHSSCQDLTAVSESSSWNANDKPCSSDNKISSAVLTREVQRRPKNSALAKQKSQSPLIALDKVVNVGGKARKKDNIPKHSIQQSDGAKYMSYLKISKKQHQIVTSMKQTGKSIQSRALNRILGNINNLNVQPYGVFVEEEHQKLNAHWLQLVKDLPTAYAIWKKLQLQKRNIINSLERELKDKLNPWMEDKQLYSAGNPLQKLDVQSHIRNSDGESLNANQSGVLAPDVENSGVMSQVSGKDHFPAKDSSSYGDQITDSSCCVQFGTNLSQILTPDCVNNKNLEDIEEEQYSFPCSPSRCHSLKRIDVEASDYFNSIQGQSLPQASFPREPHTSDLEDANPVEKHCVPELENALPVSRIPCIASNHGKMSQPVGGIRQSYTGGQAYTPSGLLSIIHHLDGDDGDEKNCFIDLKSDMPEEVDRRKMLQRKADNIFGSFPNNDQNELLQSLFKGQGVASHTTEQLHTLLKVPLNEKDEQNMSIGFQQEGSNNLMDDSQFSGQFQDQMPAPHSLSQDQQRQVNVYGQGSMSDNIYCGGRGFLRQRPNWTTNSAQIGVTAQPRLSTTPMLNQNWQFNSMLASTNGVKYANQGSQIGTDRDQSLLRASNSDQSLFSVLSQCSHLRRPITAFEPESSSDPMAASSNYGMLMDRGTTQVGSNLVQLSNPLNYLSGSNPATSLTPDNVAWMKQSRQNSGLHDPLGKMYPRSWNP